MSRHVAHTALPQIGDQGPAQLAAARVAIVGLGGLGCPSALYLAAAGVGELVLIDADVVNESNLARQVLYGPADIGQPKVRQAKRELLKQNPDVKVITHQDRFTEHTTDYLENASLVLDACDDASTKRLLNQWCVLNAVPLVHGAVIANSGHAALLVGDRQHPRPCLECLFPHPQPNADSCGERGVFSALCGLVGQSQALLALEWLMSERARAQPARLHSIACLPLEQRSFAVHKNPHCTCSRIAAWAPPR